VGVVSKIVGAIVEYTRNIDREVERCFNLNEWGDLMKYLHGLQVQAQLLIDLFQRASSLLGYVPSTYVNAGEILLREGIIDEKDFSFYRSVVGFRNIVVHEYLPVDIRIVEDILHSRSYRRVLLLAEKIYSRLRKRGLDP